MARKWIIDTDTKNISAIQLANDLRILGIKNNYFALKLYDPVLKGVDPHSPLLTEDLIMRIINECVINPWYFIREVARIPDQGGNGVPFIFNRGNAANIWCFLNGIQYYDVKPRQTGKTQSNIAIIDWAFLLGTTNSEFMFVNKDQGAANANLSRLKDQRDLLPKYLQFKFAYDSDTSKKVEGTNNVTSISNVNNNNKIITSPKATSKEKAENIGRGCTQPIQYFDEVEFTSFIKTIVQTSGPAYKSASTNAKRNGAIYGRIYTTTPGDLDNAPCQDAMEILEGACKWSENFYDWEPQEVSDYIDKNSTNGIVYIEYSYKQLGLDEAWFVETAKLLLNDPIMIKRELLLRRIRGSSESPFNPEDLELIQEYERSPIEELFFINKLYKLDIYEPLQRRKIYMVSVDCGTGIGEDNTAITIIDPDSEEPVAEFKSPYIGIEHAKKLIYILIKKHIPRSILAIERNHVGTAIIQGLQAMGLSNSIYSDTDKGLGEEVDDKLDKKGYLEKQAARRRLYGVYTERGSRKVMIDILFSRVRDFKQKFITKNIINDINKLVKTKAGKIEAAPGSHDDSIMSYLIGMYVLTYGKNLERYGYVRGVIKEEERNQGLIEEAIEEMEDEELKTQFKEMRRGIEEDPSEKYAQEVFKALQNMRREDKTQYNAGSNVELVDCDDDSMDAAIPYSFFDELND